MTKTCLKDTDQSVELKRHRRDLKIKGLCSLRHTQSIHYLFPAHSFLHFVSSHCRWEEEIFWGNTYMDYLALGKRVQTCLNCLFEDSVYSVYRCSLGRSSECSSWIAQFQKQHSTPHLHKGAIYTTTPEFNILEVPAKKIDGGVTTTVIALTSWVQVLPRLELLVLCLAQPRGNAAEAWHRSLPTRPPSTSAFKDGFNNFTSYIETCLVMFLLVIYDES